MHVFLKMLFILSLSLNLAWSQDTLKSDALKLWQKRDVKESLAEAINKFEQLHKSNPSDNEILVYLVRSNFIMGDSHSKDKEQKLKYFEKAFSYGDKALESNKEYSAKIKKGDDIEDAVKALTVNEVPQMYWTAASIGKFARTTGIFASMKYKGKILALISRVEELQPSYFYGAVNRYWGSYYAVIPRIAGKDLKKSKNNFEKSLQLAPEYLGTKVLMAETYLVEKDDKSDFRKLLNEVIQDSTHDNHPELGPENRMEKIKAKHLLEKADDLF